MTSFRRFGRYRLAAVAATILFNSLVSMPSLAERPCHEMGIFEIYDALIPLESSQPLALGSLAIIVRYVPGDTSIDREKKVVLLVTDETQTLDVWSPAVTSIYQQWRNIRKLAPRENCDEEVLRRIQIDRGTMTGKSVTHLYRELRELRVPVVLDSSIYLDAPRFEIVVETPMNRCEYRLYDSKALKRPHPLVRWARAVMSVANNAHSQ